jgi:hypothetical protein
MGGSVKESGYVAEGVGRDDVNGEMSGKGFQPLGHAREELPVQGQGAVEIKDEMSEFEDFSPGDVDADHDDSPD